VWHPEIVDSKIADRNEVVLCSVNFRFIQGEPNHRDALASGEWVMQGVTKLSASNRDDDFG
jgi:hypothetical protein